MTDPNGARLALDAGQTGIKLRFERPGVSPVEEVLPGVRTHEPLLPQLAAAVRHVHDVSGTPVATVASGVSGLTEEGADASALLSLVGSLGAHRVLLAHDSITSFLGTLGDRRGAVVASGTGVVTLAVGRELVARVDGWGNIMGDAGSGHWIGREALDAAMRAYDGRGPETGLLGLLRDRWPNAEEAYIQLQGDPDRVRTVASFAGPTAYLAAEGDAVARRICLSAARELAHSVDAALRRVAGPGQGRPGDGAADGSGERPDDGPDVSAIGGVFGSALIRDRFDALLRERYPAMRPHAPHGTGLDGAATLATLPEGHPLRAHVAVASSDG
ncbi:hypothetical protein LQ757_01255 [Agromyces sp. SYSU K20354]|uniref:N-acetylglucosamine kinase n=1 Tax=Agromyces cavernae TaxID=2898659 RepID=UPI001E45F227|nr:BadF/BadG/BcrA/BcrD ATPase family protein [Agromyces cavernae]MCD2440892.1 hypothetical protein [Agromyces cavernae]